MSIKSTLFVGAVLLWAQTVQAGAAPIISGKYLWSMIITCGVVNPGSEGNQGSWIATATFNSTTGMASVSGIESFTPIVNGTSGQATQNPFSAGPLPYSNTATTFTIGGQTSQVFYGKVINGIVQQFVFSQIYSNTGVASPNCVNTGTVTLIDDGSRLP